MTALTIVEAVMVGFVYLASPKIEIWALLNYYRQLVVEFQKQQVLGVHNHVLGLRVAKSLPLEPSKVMPYPAVVALDGISLGLGLFQPICREHFSVRLPVVGEESESLQIQVQGHPAHLAGLDVRLALHRVVEAAILALVSLSSANHPAPHTAGTFASGTIHSRHWFGSYGKDT